MQFKFGGVVKRSIGIVEIEMPLRYGNMLKFNCYIVSANVPLLLVLDVMEREVYLLIFLT